MTRPYAKVVPTLIGEPVLAGEKAPPYVIGDATAYIVIDPSAPGGRAWFDYPNASKDYRDHYERFGQKADQAAKDARRAAEFQERVRLNPASPTSLPPKRRSRSTWTIRLKGSVTPPRLRTLTPISPSGSPRLPPPRRYWPTW